MLWVLTEARAWAPAGHGHAHRHWHGAGTCALSFVGHGLGNCCGQGSWGVGRCIGPLLLSQGPASPTPRRTCHSGAPPTTVLQSGRMSTARRTSVCSSSAVLVHALQIRVGRRPQSASLVARNAMTKRETDALLGHDGLCRGAGPGVTAELTAKPSKAKPTKAKYHKDKKCRGGSLRFVDFFCFVCVFHSSGPGLPETSPGQATQRPALPTCGGIVGGYSVGEGAATHRPEGQHVQVSL